VPVTVADDAVVRWLGELHAPGLRSLLRGLAHLGSWWTLSVLGIGLPAALLVLRRWRHLIVWLLVWNFLMYVVGILNVVARRPRPFGVDLGTSWGGWAMPSMEVAHLTAISMGVLYTLVPEGRWRNRGKWVAAGLVAVVVIARVALGTEAPGDVLLTVGISVSIPLLAFRRFAPSEVFPVVYRRGRSAHLDIGGERGLAIRRALEDQLGLVVKEVKPFGLSGSAGSTPLRITLDGDPPRQLFAKLYAQSHLHADRWYKLGRELLYGRLEDEKPFNTVRRLVQQEDYALSLMQRAGLPSPTPFGFVELTPDREYLLVTEFFQDATELGEAQVDQRIIDDGLAIIRRLWDAGLAVCSSPQQVYERALRQFSVDEISEGFAAARGLVLPSQLRQLLRAEGRDLHAEFTRLLPSPPRPIRVQRWSARRVALGTAIVLLLVLVGLNPTVIFDNRMAVRTSLGIHGLDCGRLEPLWLEAQSVPSASLVPCVRSRVPGWMVADVAVNNGRSVITLEHDRAGKGAVVVRLAAGCDTAGAVETPSPTQGVRRFQLVDPGTDAFGATWYDRFPGGCVTHRLHSTGDIEGSFAVELPGLLGFASRDALRNALAERSDGRLRLQ
jgi:hypothetical protein